ncbi:MAG TPA: sulfatase-like hydrolase/transferase [Candidatus Aquabacterium excrementipullorum]|nr:sulfatase-like hydrolase/transferase [Candidatus Aquabacterium excrementipullorum]
MGLWLAAFVSFNLAVRLGLAAFNGDATAWSPVHLLPTVLIGAAFDLGVGLCALAPLAVLAVLWPKRASRSLGWLLTVLLWPLCMVMVCVGASEFTFWNEFASRFNFIAVDYLIYTNEVLGNLRESYNLPLMFALAALLATGMWWWLSGRTRSQLRSEAGQGTSRPWFALCAWLLAASAVMAGLDSRFKEFSDNAQINELAGNGYYDFWHAFRTNEIDYDRFYKTLPHNEALAELEEEVLVGSRMPVTISQRPYDREIKAEGPPRHYNVVLISVESLSAEFLGAFGNRQGLTPNLDRLAKQGMLFTHLYATGTRTVRGLEALTLSVPPTPGHSIVKRPDNGQLFTLGEVFREQGYEPLYLYGGYGYFDNMNAFFGGNGYTVVDRTALAPKDIHFENIWGVADEDLFTLALGQLDQRQAKGKPFFAHIMTTSNHRPFTYPDGRIDIPSHTGREGGVKYTDYAIGDFIERARRHAWFDNTVFVIVADHTHKGRGKQDLPIENYHIPMIVYAPGFVQPSVVDTISSQIDVGPTVLGMLNVSYRSRFFGHDILSAEGRQHQRALLANYQTVGYYEEGRVVELKPNARYRVVDAGSGKEMPMDALSVDLLGDAISYYQLASEAYRHGDLKLSVASTTPTVH